MKTLTVITTTYNRDYCLHQVYESLLRQTSDDFLWLIIDDGSTDHTKELVYGWIEEGKIEIKYVYKPNGGMHTVRNRAYELCDTELNVIIDSDDWMTDDAVEQIVRFWKERGKSCYAGIISNNISPTGKLIGSELPEGIHDCTITDLFGKYGVKGDKKLIYRSELSKLYPYPEFEGEKFYPASYKFRLLDRDYTMLIMERFTCVVDYNEDSMSNAASKNRQYKNCCRGFAHYRNEMIKLSSSSSFKFRNSVHYIAESLFAKDKAFIKNSNAKGWTVVALPLGFTYYLYLKYKTRN